MILYKRYQGTIPSSLQGHTYTITLEREDANPTEPMRELHFYGEGFTLEREPQESLLTPILPSRLTLFLVSEYNFQLEHIAKDTKEWRARLTLNGSTLFLGRLETGLYEEDFAEPPYEVRLTATCGLQSLYDQDLNPEDIPTNSCGVTLVADFLNWILLSAYPKGYARNSLIKESVAKREIFLDPFDFSDEEDKPISKGEALETLLDNLCLSVYSVGALFVVADILQLGSTPTILLGNASTPLYATPQLQSDRGIGQLTLSLPSNEVSSIAPYFTPKDPIPTTLLPEKPFGCLGRAFPPRVRQLAVTNTTTAVAPSTKEREEGISLKLFHTGPSSNPDSQGVFFGFELDEPFFRFPIEVLIPMRFKLEESTPAHKYGEVMALLDGYLCHYNTAQGLCQVLYQSSIGDVYRQVTVSDPWSLHQAEYKEPSRALYTDTQSGMGRTPREKNTAGWTDCRMAHNVMKDDLKTSRYASFSEELKSNRNYCRVSQEDLYSKEHFAVFRFCFLPPLRHLMAYHNGIRSSQGETPKPDPNYVLFRIPQEFYHYHKEPGHREETSTRVYADQIIIGKISIKYLTKEDKENPYTQWITADRATSWLRNIDKELTYSTEEPSLVQKNALRYKLLTAEGKHLPYLYEENGKPITLVEYFSERYMRVYARPYDKLTVTAKSTPTPRLIGVNRFAVKGRQGKTYIAMGGTYHPGDGASEELTLFEAPSPHREDTSFIL